MTRVLVVDNHELVREGLQTILDCENNVEVVGTASDGYSAVRLSQELSPDVIIMDVRMQRMDGIEACRKIKKALPETNILMLSIYDDDGDVFKAIEAGASGYMIKDFSSSDLLKALEAVGQGNSFFHPIIAKKIANKLCNISDREKEKFSLFANLSKREVQILELIGKGLSNKDIADFLFISHGTVRSHVSNILRKLSKRDRTQLALYAKSAGIVD